MEFIVREGRPEDAEQVIAHINRLTWRMQSDLLGAQG